MPKNIKIILLFLCLNINLFSQTIPASKLTYKIPYNDKIKIDGLNNDWKGPALTIPIYGDRYDENQSEKDLNGNMSVAWNENGLLLCFKITDDQLIETSDKNNYWQYDSIEIFTADKWGGTEMLQYIFSPGISENLNSPGYTLTDRRKKVIPPSAVKDPIYRRTYKKHSYILEISIPHANLGKTIKENIEYGLQVYINDKDKDNKKRWIWNHHSDSHFNTRSIYKLLLVKDYDQSQFEGNIKAFFEDEKELKLFVCAGSEYSDSEVTLIRNFSYPVKKEFFKYQNYYKADLSFIPENNFLPLYLFVADKFIGVVDPKTIDCYYNKMEKENYSEDIFKFKIQNEELKNKKGKILFTGSSSIRGWLTMQDDLRPHFVINRGFGGSQADDVLKYIDTLILDLKPEKIFYYEGDNDLASGKTAQQFIDTTKQIIRKIQESLSETDIYLLSVKPSPSRESLLPQVMQANKMLAQLASENKKIYYIDICTSMLNKDGTIKKELFLDDMLHMKPAGYEIWTSIISKYL